MVTIYCGKRLISEFHTYNKLKGCQNLSTKKRRQKRHIIPFDRVFRPDPYGDLDDTRPVEVRKGKKGRPKVSIPWEVIKDA